MTVKVSVQDLRIGMFIHLDLGWMSHPFPLSSFKIVSADQIETIRALGLKELRWSPERSDLEPVQAADEGTLTLHAPAGAAEALAPAQAAQDTLTPSWRAQEEAQQQALARALDAQQLAQRQCERQYAEACRDFRRLMDAVHGEPALARESAQQLTRALLDKMLVDGEAVVRVLGEPMGDRGSAHAMNVGIVAMLLGRQLALSEADMMDLGMGALLHDVGKIALPDRVRLPHEDFSSAEQRLYRDHVAQGVSQARRMGLSPGTLLVIAQHHEHADGSGWPQGVAQDKMSAAARIVAMVNRYDNLCNAAVPSRSLTPHEALSRMFSQSRTQFDAVLLNSFIKMMGIYPPGSLVQLSDDRYAMVMTVNSARPLKPCVLVHERDVPVDQALHLDLERVTGLGIRRSLKPAQLPVATLEYLAPRQRVAYFFDIQTPLAASEERAA